MAQCLERRVSRVVLELLDPLRDALCAKVLRPRVTSDKLACLGKLASQQIDVIIRPACRANIRQEVFDTEDVLPRLNIIEEQVKPLRWNGSRDLSHPTY